MIHYILGMIFICHTLVLFGMEIDDTNMAATTKSKGLLAILCPIRSCNSIFTRTDPKKSDLPSKVFRHLESIHSVNTENISKTALQNEIFSLPSRQQRYNFLCKCGATITSNKSIKKLKYNVDKHCASKKCTIKNTLYFQEKNITKKTIIKKQCKDCTEIIKSYDPVALKQLYKKHQNFCRLDHLPDENNDTIQEQSL